MRASGTHSYRWRRRLVPCLGLVAGLVIGTATAASVRADEFVGAASCGTCHEKEYNQWRASGHALALARLSKTQQRDRVCRSCHTMAPLEDDPALAGVQCESCHGPGTFYSPRNVMKDPELARLMGLTEMSKTTCQLCHKSDGPGVLPFDFEAKLELVRHTPTAPPADAPKPKAKAKEGGS